MNQKLGLRVFPAIVSDASTRDEKMDMGMIDELPCPSLEEAHHADIRAEKPFVFGQEHDRFSGSLEKQMNHLFLPAPEQGSQSFRHGDGRHEIRNWQEQLELFFEPVICAVVLTFRAMPVPAGVIAVMDFITRVAEIFLTAHLRGSAGSDMLHRLPV